MSLDTLNYRKKLALIRSRNSDSFHKRGQAPNIDMIRQKSWLVVHRDVFQKWEKISWFLDHSGNSNSKYVWWWMLTRLIMIIPQHREISNPNVVHMKLIMLNVNYISIIEKNTTHLCQTENTNKKDLFQVLIKIINP